MAARTKSLGSAIIVVFGLGLFKIEWLYNPAFAPTVQSTPVLWIIKSLLVAAALLFGFALLVLTKSASTTREFATASQHLSIRANDEGKPIPNVIFTSIYRAYLDLQKRNAEKWRNLKQAQGIIGWGMALVLLAVVLYILFSVPPTIK